MTINKTLLYLYPLLKHWDVNLRNSIYKLGLVKVGVSDEHYGNDLTDVIFCKCKVTNGFKYLLNTFVDEPYFVTDYVHVDLKHHVLVFKVPEGSVEAFLKGKYSRIASREIIDACFNKTTVSKGKEVYTKSYSVIAKRENYKTVFLDKLNAKFNTKLTLDDITDDFELEFPPTIGDETI